MSETCETVVIKGQKGDALIINKSDYDKSKHELYKKKPSVVKTKKPSIVEKNGKFVIIDGEGKQIAEEAFATEADAKAMLDLLVGK